ncbi:MAG TPA: HNH endonuclease signature motif containing protein, partial [Propionibacteriaceae bacterium]
TLAAAARSLGASDPRTEQQRRSDLFADLLLGRLTFNDHDNDTDDDDGDGDDTQVSKDSDGGDATAAEADRSKWLEVEIIDPDTGELLGTQLQRVDGDGQPIGEPVDAVIHQPLGQTPTLVRRPRKVRIGVVVPLSSLLGNTDTPAELADRSGFTPAETLRQQIAETLDTDSRNQVLFTRLLTDDGGRLLDVTELGRYASTRLAEAIKIRAGTCRFPTCTVPAERCDLDHHNPHPRGPTSGTNQDPFCRRHHRGKTFAWHAALRDDHGVDWTMPDAQHYRCLDQPLPTGMAA